MDAIIGRPAPLEDGPTLPPVRALHELPDIGIQSSGGEGSEDQMKDCSIKERRVRGAAVQSSIPRCPSLPPIGTFPYPVSGPRVECRRDLGIDGQGENRIVRRGRGSKILERSNTVAPKAVWVGGLLGLGLGERSPETAPRASAVAALQRPPPFTPTYTVVGVCGSIATVLARTSSLPWSSGVQDRPPSLLLTSLFLLVSLP
jgi:hypothetical protein